MFFFFQAEDGIRDAQESRGLGDVYKRQDGDGDAGAEVHRGRPGQLRLEGADEAAAGVEHEGCLLYTSDAADDLLCVDLGGRRIIKKKKEQHSFSLSLYPTVATLSTL